MKKIFLLLLIAVALQAQATDYYVRTDGSNANNGLANTSGGAWLTIEHAAVTVPAGAHNIYVGAGTFDLATTVNLPVGVSVIGAGTGTIITSTSISGNYNPLFFLSSAAGTAGNQRLENFAMNGNSLNVWVGIRVSGRSFVTCKKITASNFYFCAFAFNSQGSLFGDDLRDPGNFDIHLETATYAVGNSVDSCVTTNCSGYNNWDGTGFYGSGHIWFCGQDGFTITNNNMQQTQRVQRRNGWCIKSQSWTKNTLINNNYLEAAPYPYATNGHSDPLIDGGAQYWNFSVELFFTSVLEFSYNISKGALDINKPIKRTFAYGLYAHHNTFGRDALTANQENGIILEYDVSGIRIDSNIMKYITEPVSFSPRLNSLIDSVAITKNLMHNFGQLSQQFFGHVFFSHDQGQPYNMQNIFIKKNTFSADNVNQSSSGIVVSNLYTGTANTLYIEDNIFEKFGQYAITSADGSKLTGVYIRNNLFYQNGEDIKWGNFAGNSAPPNAPYVSTPNYTGNPLFDANYNLQAGSPAIGAATDGGNIGHTGGVAGPDVTPPTIISTNPANSATGVAPGVYNIVINFGEAMNTATLNSTNITGIGGSITAASTYASIAATLLPGTTYTITVNGVQDVAGNTIAAPYVFSFTTAAAPLAPGGDAIFIIKGLFKN